MNSTDKTKPRDPRDWHPADVLAALKKSGWTLRRLSLSLGYGPNWAQAALKRPYPHAERVIAEKCGIPARVMWPSRYTPDGEPIQRGEVKLRQGPRPKRGANEAHADKASSMPALAEVPLRGGH